MTIPILNSFIYQILLQTVENPASQQAENINRLFNAFNIAAGGMLLAPGIKNAPRKRSSFLAGFGLARYDVRRYHYHLHHYHGLCFRGARAYLAARSTHGAYFAKPGLVHDSILCFVCIDAS